MSSALLIMYSDKAVNYMYNVVHVRDCDDKYRAVIDHSKDIVAMSRNNSVLTRYKADNYIDLMILSQYLSAMYLYDRAMSMYKMVSNSNKLQFIKSRFFGGVHENFEGIFHFYVSAVTINGIPLAVISERSTIWKI